MCSLSTFALYALLELGSNYRAAQHIFGVFVTLVFLENYWQSDVLGISEFTFTASLQLEIKTNWIHSTAKHILELLRAICDERQLSDSGYSLLVFSRFARASMSEKLHSS